MKSARRYTMPFHRRFVAPIQNGTKTVTRRFTPRHVDTLLRAAVPEDGQPPWRWPTFANLTVIGCRSERLWDLTVIGCRSERLWDLAGLEAGLEGFSDESGLPSPSEQFMEFWDVLYADNPKAQWAANPTIWRIEFRKEQ